MELLWRAGKLIVRSYPDLERAVRQAEKLYEMSESFEGYCPHKRCGIMSKFNHPPYKLGWVAEHTGVDWCSLSIYLPKKDEKSN